MTEPSQLSPRRPATVRQTPLLARALFAIALIFTLLGLVETGFRVANILTGGSFAARLTPDLELGIRSWTVHHAISLSSGAFSTSVGAM